MTFQLVRTVLNVCFMLADAGVTGKLVSNACDAKSHLAVCPPRTVNVPLLLSLYAQKVHNCPINGLIAGTAVGLND